MALVTVLTRDPAVRAAIKSPPGPAHHIASTRSWCRFLWLVRERPVTVAVLDSAAFSRGRTAADAIPELQRRFPSLALVLAYRDEPTDPYALFRLGRAKVGALSLVRLDGLAHGLRGAILRAATHCTEAHVARAIGTRLPTREAGVIRLALHGVQVGWGADDLAAAAGFTRAHLSVRLRSHGLPSAGHLLLWAKLLHAGHWLTDPARSAESVSRQLDYSSGAAFRRALANYLDMTPTEVIEAGGLSLVLSRFLDVCGAGDSVWLNRSVA